MADVGPRSPALSTTADTETTADANTGATADTDTGETIDSVDTTDTAGSEPPDDGGRRGEGVDRDDPLLAWALASFHAALFVLVPLALAHAVAPVALGDLLGGLDTAVGSALYLVLWGSTWWSNRRYLAASDFEDARGTLRAGARWGAPTGLPLLLPVVVATLVATNPVFALLLLAVGSVVALLVGAAAGAVFAGVDLALDRLAGRVLG